MQLMWQLQGWRLIFIAALMGTAAALMVYVEGRRLLHAAIDDRYGQGLRFWRQYSLGQRLSYALTFFFCHGVRDLWRLVTLVAFDLFVVFALLAPFWRSVYFEDWDPALAVAMGLVGVSIYIAWKLRQGRELCPVHGWSAETWQCERCGEFHAEADDRLRRKKGGKAAAAPALTFSDRFSWHGFWERRLDRLNQRLEDPRTAG